MRLTGGAILVRSLAAHGVELVLGIPGTHNLGIYAALPEYGVRHVSVRHEQGAGYAADGYARATGRPGVLITTTGPAVLNAATAVAQAYSDSVPLLVVSPAMPTTHPSGGDGTLHEVKDQQAAMDAVCERSIHVDRVADIPAAVQECFRLMLVGRPRSVHLEIPLDLVDAEAEVADEPPVWHPERRPVDVTAAVTAVAPAHRPVMIVGGGASGAAMGVTALAERLGAAVVMTTNGKGVVPADHPCVVGAGLQHPAFVDLVRAADVLLVVGSELAPADLWLGPVQASCPVVRIDVDADAVARNVQPDVAVVADAAVAVGAMLEALDGTGPADTSWVVPVREAFGAQARAEGAVYLGICRALTEALPRDAIVAADNAMVSYYGALGNLPTYEPRSFLFPTGLGTLGYALPAAIGAKLAHPDRAVVALHGDGGLMFTVQELATAAAAGAPVVVLVVDNGGYGEIGNEMADRGEPVHAVALGGVDFPALAGALGCRGRTVDEMDLAQAVREALQAEVPTLLHLRESSRAADLLSAAQA